MRQEICEPYSTSAVALLRVVHVALLCLLCGGLLWSREAILIVGIVFIAGEWCAYEAYIRVYARRRARAYRDGEVLDAHVVDKRFAWRGGHGTLLVQYTWGGTAMQSRGAVSDMVWHRCKAGDRIAIRVSHAAPAVWVADRSADADQTTSRHG